MLRFWILIVTTFTLSHGGCALIDGGGSGADAPSPRSPDPGSSDSDGAPLSGAWAYSDFASTTSDCALSSLFGGDGDFQLENHDDGSFTVFPEDGTAPFDCFLDGIRDFSCPERAGQTIDLRDDGIDAVLTTRTNAEGSVSSAMAMSGTQTSPVACSGTQCVIVESMLGADFPCTYRVSYLAVHQ